MHITILFVVRYGIFHFIETRFVRTVDRVSRHDSTLGGGEKRLDRQHRGTLTLVIFTRRRGAASFVVHGDGRSVCLFDCNLGLRRFSLNLNAEGVHLRRIGLVPVKHGDDVGIGKIPRHFNKPINERGDLLVPRGGHHRLKNLVPGRKRGHRVVVQLGELLHENIKVFDDHRYVRCLLAARVRHQTAHSHLEPLRHSLADLAKDPPLVVFADHTDAVHRLLVHLLFTRCALARFLRFLRQKFIERLLLLDHPHGADERRLAASTGEKRRANRAPQRRLEAVHRIIDGCELNGGGLRHR